MSDSFLSCVAAFGVLLLCGFGYCYVLSFDDKESCVGSWMRGKVMVSGSRLWLLWPVTGITLWLACSSMLSLESVAVGGAGIGFAQLFALIWAFWSMHVNETTNNKFGSAWGRSCKRLLDTLLERVRNWANKFLGEERDEKESPPMRGTESCGKGQGQGMGEVVNPISFNQRRNENGNNTSYAKDTDCDQGSLDVLPERTGDIGDHDTGLRSRLMCGRYDVCSWLKNGYFATKAEARKLWLDMRVRLLLVAALLLLSFAWWRVVFVWLYTDHPRRNGAPNHDAFNLSKIAPYVFDADCLRSEGAKELVAADEFASKMLDDELSLGGVVGSALYNILLLMSTCIASVPIPWSHRQRAASKLRHIEMLPSGRKSGALKKHLNGAEKVTESTKFPTPERFWWLLWVFLMVAQLLLAYVSLAMVCVAYLSAQHRFGSCMRTTGHGLPLLHAAALVGGAFYPPILSKLALIMTYNAVLVEGLRVADVEPHCELGLDVTEQENRQYNTEKESKQYAEKLENKTEVQLGNECWDLLSQTYPADDHANDDTSSDEKRWTDGILRWALSRSDKHNQHGFGMQVMLCAPVLTLWGYGYLLAGASMTFVFGVPLLLFSSLPLLVCIISVFILLRKIGMIVFIDKESTKWDRALLRPLFRKLRSSFSPFVIKLPAKGDGTLSRREVKKALRDENCVDESEITLHKLLGNPDPNDKARIDEIYNEIDEDGNGEIDFEEFKNYFEKQNKLIDKAKDDRRRHSSVADGRIFRRHSSVVGENKEDDKVTEDELKQMFDEIDQQPLPLEAFATFWKGSGSNLNFSLAQGLAAFALSVPAFGGALLAFAVYKDGFGTDSAGLLQVLCEVAMGCHTTFSDGCDWHFEFPQWHFEYVNFIAAFRLAGAAVTRFAFYQEFNADYWRQAAMATVAGSVGISLIRFLASFAQPPSMSVDLAVCNTTANIESAEQPDSAENSECVSLRRALEYVGKHRAADIVNVKGLIQVRQDGSSVVMRVLRNHVKELQQTNDELQQMNEQLRHQLFEAELKQKCQEAVVRNSASGNYQEGENKNATLVRHQTFSAVV